ENDKKISVKDVIRIDSELLDNISDLIEQHESTSLNNILTDLHPADIAEIINHLAFQDARFVFELLDTETASEVVVELDENLRERILKKIDTEKITDIVDELETDDATDIVSDLPEPIAEEVLENIDTEDSQDVKELLKYPEDSAGGIMSSEFVFVYEDSSVKTAIKTVRKHAEEFENIYYIYVLNYLGELKGVVNLKSLLVNSLRKKINSVMEEDLIYVTPEVDQEEVAIMMKKYDLVSIPVVDKSKIMLGRITIDDVVDVIQEEADEDIQKLAGLSEEQESSDSIFRISRIRLPWLIIALAIEFLGVWLLSEYEHILKDFTIAAFFIPVVMAMGGSTGTQASIVMVKGLGAGEVWLSGSIKKLIKEFSVALLNGLALGILLFLVSFIFFREIKLVLVISLALLIIIIFSTMIGATIPVILKRLNIDPAVATGPFVTTTNDVLGLFIYMIIITLFIIP
ncbi:magnesium transporter, partial [Bacteroidota bacterium]